MAYQAGETIRLTSTITDSDGVAADPTTITTTIENPSGVEKVAAAAMTKSVKGSYYYDYDIPSINVGGTGTYTYKVTATGSGGRVTISKSSFIVDEPI